MAEPDTINDSSSEVLAEFIDASWTAADIADVEANAVMHPDTLRELQAYEETLRGSTAELTRHDRHAFTFATLVDHVLDPDIVRSGHDAIAEAMVEVKVARLEGLGMTDADTLECLHELTHAYLSHNSLRSLDGLEFLSNLTVLVVIGNQIESLGVVAGLPLELLDARDNRIAEIAGSLPLTLKRLSLAGNPCAANPTELMEQAAAACPELAVVDDEPVLREDVNTTQSDSDGLEAHITDADFDDIVDDAATRQLRLALPVADGSSSAVRNMTDELLRRYKGEVAHKVKNMAQRERDAHDGADDRPEATDERDDATATQHQLDQELRFALRHQCNVAQSRVNDMWDDGAVLLRDHQGRRDRTRAPVQGRAYSRALELLKSYTGERDLDKYRTERPASADGSRT